MGKRPVMEQDSHSSRCFCIAHCVLMVANFIQYKKADPVNMTVINSLVERLRENPADSLLQNEIRTLDLLSRKAYFTSTWQIRTGGYLLLVLVAIVIISIQIIEYRRKITPVISSQYEDETMLQHKKARRWIIAGGSLILITAVVFGVVSADELSDKLNRTVSGDSGSFEQSLTSGEVAVTELTAGTSDSVEIVATNAGG